MKRKWEKPVVVRLVAGKANDWTDDLKQPNSPLPTKT